MRVLLFSDHHGFAWKLYSPILPSGLPARLQDGLDVLNQIAAVAKREKVDVILFGGDLFHMRGTISVVTWNALYDAIMRLRIHALVGLLVGNHDQCNRAGDIHSIYGLGTVVLVMDKPQWYTFEVPCCKLTRKPVALHVLAVPYTKDKEEIKNTISGLAPSPPRNLEPTALLGHFGVDGAQVGSNIVLINKDVPAVGDLGTGQVDQVFLGHYHEPQPLATNARFLGATHHHNWGDVGSKRGCWLWDTAEQQPYSDPTFVPLQAPEFRVIEYGTKLTRDLAGHFVRMRVNYVPPRDDMERYGREALSLGLRSFEFTYPELSNSSGTAPSLIFQPGMDVNAMLEGYIEAAEQDVRLDSDVLIDMGKEFLQAATQG